MCLHQHHLIGVLGTVEVLDDVLVGSGCPLHAGDVVFARIPLQIRPDGFAPVRWDDAHPGGGQGLTDLRIGDAGEGGVERVGVVDQQELLHTAGVELPIGDVLAIGAPTEAVPDSEFLFVSPVEVAVDEGRASSPGESGDVAVAQTLDVDVVLPDVRDAVTLGRELREHQGRFFGVSAQLLELPAPEVQHPVIASPSRLYGSSCR